MAEGRVDRWLRPRYVFPALAGLLVLAVVWAPESANDSESTMRLTTKGTDPWGAKGLYDMLGILGVKVEQRLTPFRAPLDSDAVYAVLLPDEEPTARQTGALLDAVRRGAGLIVLPRVGSAFADSLGIERSRYWERAFVASVDTLFGADRNDHAGLGYQGSSDTVVRTPVLARRDSARREGPVEAVLNFDPSENARAFHHYLRATVKSDSDSTRSFPEDARTLLFAQHSQKYPVIVTRRLGRGRVVTIADGNFLRNAVLRRGDGAVLAVRVIEWVDPSLTMPVVFDEYDQGYGDHPDMVSIVARALSSTAEGRVTLQVAIAAIILLLAAAVRPIAPVPRTVIERRSPLEHVGALSRAYARIGATRLSAQRLVRGLRRRHPLGATGAVDDDAYLALLRSRAAGVQADVDLLRRAMREPLPAGEFVRAGAAIDHIERTLTS